jgi:dinuclear metal center YbgI/SA1388 family protein
MKLEPLLQYADAYLGIPEHPDYPNAMNGLQVGGPPEVTTIAGAVDASVDAIEAAAERGVDVLFVHHGLFWAGLQPVTGRHLRKLQTLLRKELALYAAHLPLDGHAEVGNCAQLGRAMALGLKGRFAPYQGTDIGWWGELDGAESAEDLRHRLSEALGGGPVRLIPGGPERVERVGVVTGGGASFVNEAVDLGLDALVTGEGSHHTYFDAMELGIHVLFGGHYATETFGVRALVRHLAERFDLQSSFIDLPTGL